MSTLRSLLTEGHALGVGVRVLGAPNATKMRRPPGKDTLVRKSNRPAEPIPEGTRCDCRKAHATVQVWFRQLSAGHVGKNGDTLYQEEVVGTLMLCSTCYADMLAMDPDLSLEPLEKAYV